MRVNKLTVILMAVLVFGAAITQAAQLHAYYSFDDSSNLAKDDSGNGVSMRNDNDYLAPSYSANGAVNGAAVFDGETQGYRGDPSLYRPGSFTMSFWIKPNSTPNVNFISPWNNGKGITMRADGSFKLYVYNTGGNTQLNSSVAPVVGQWTHLVVRYDADEQLDAETGDFVGTAEFFVDGTLTRAVSNVRYTTDDTGDLCFAKRDTTAVFDGSFDEFVVFDGTLTDDQIGYLASKEATVLNVLEYEPDPEPAKMLYAYYSFDDSGDLGKDYSGRGLDLITNSNLLGATYSADGAVNGSAVFDGSTHGYLVDTGVINAGSYTASFWVRPYEPAAQYKTIFAVTGTSAAFTFNATDTEYNFYQYHSDGNDRTKFHKPVANEWLHFVARFTTDGSTDESGDFIGDFDFFIDGQEMTGAAKVGAKNRLIGASYYILGRRNASDIFKGDIDEAAFFKGALTDEEIIGLATKEATPLNVIGYKLPDTMLRAYYSFDDEENLARDDSGNGLDLETTPIYGGADYNAEGVVNGCAKFDGATQGYLVDTAVLNAGSYTVSFWAKPDELGSAYKTIFGRSGTASGFLFNADSGDYGFYPYYTNPADPTKIIADRVRLVKPAAGVWMHFAIRFTTDGSTDENGDFIGDFSYFMDGQEKKSVAEFGTKHKIIGATKYILGRANASDIFKGDVDEVAYFKGNLTDEEIGYLASRVATPLNVIGFEPDATISYKPIAYYSLNDANGIFFGNDDSGNFKHLVNDDYELPEYTNKGAVKGAATFDGNLQGLKYFGAALYPKGSFSFSMWVKCNQMGTDQYMCRPSHRGYSFQAGSGLYRFYVMDHESNINISSGKYIATDDDWIHFVGTYEADGTGVDENDNYTGTATLYMDGAQVGRTENVKYFSNSNIMYIGRRGTSEKFKGSLDELAFWDVALQDWQVAGLATGKYTPITLPNALIQDADLNGDGIVNIEDFAILASNWLKSSY